ncbi:MAG: helix-turn-helix transcriptional regulator [Oscillibacter sp.]|nr:helix-turn-helix transcriptional regulator [Oscillibacter sp.]
MQEQLAGRTIRQKRLERGLTHEELCAGLYDPATLSRIENGKQTPSRNRLNALFQRLGEPHDRYYTILTSSEAEADRLRSEIDDNIARFQKSLGEEKHQVRLDALEQLDQLESIMEDDDNITSQYILAARAILGKESGPYDLEVRLDMLLRAIWLTVPQLDLEALDRRLYSFDEAEIISQIAGTYSDAGQHEKAAGIFYQLLTYMREHYQNVTYPSRHIVPATLNYARELCLMGRYREALETAAQGQKTCLGYGYCLSLPDLLAVMAECRYAMGEEEQSRALYLQSYYLFEETGNAYGSAQVKAEACQRFGPEFPL